MKEVVQTYSKSDVIKLLLNTTRSRAHNFPHIQDQSVKILDANGSYKSIISWASAAKLDQHQQRAFQILTATFVMAIQDGACDDDNYCFGGGPMSIHRNKDQLDYERCMLSKLSARDKRKTDQLICFIHGSGGCGKSTIVDLVLDYCKEYCSHILNFIFDSRTIVVMAMTSVGATLINGETVHSALLNTSDLKPCMTQAWCQTKMVIVDEISFASNTHIAKMNNRLGNLMLKQRSPFGGLHVIFAGNFWQLELVGARMPLYKVGGEEFEASVNWLLY